MANLGTRKEQAGIANKPYYIGSGGVNATGNSILDMVGSSNLGTSVIGANTLSPFKSFTIDGDGVYTAPITTGVVVPLTVVVKIGTELSYQASFDITAASVSKDFWFEVDVNDISVASGSIHNVSVVGRLYYQLAASDVMNHKKFTATGSSNFNTSVAMPIVVQAYYTIPNLVPAAQLLNYSLTASRSQITTNF